MNLLGNALKFTETGQVALHTDLVQATADDVTLRFTIRDTGIGIPNSRLATLFQAFSQIDPSSTRKYGGTGLGLAISKRIVECMKGEIGVESESTQGSTFWFTVCLRQQIAVQTGVVTSTLPGMVAGKGHATVAEQPHILVAEDNPVNQKLIGRLLEKLGYHAKVVFNGHEAFEEAATNSYAAVLMDCQMPEMDGLSATGEIRAREVALNLSHLPIIALTAHIMPGDRERCLAAGMDDYLSKPLNPDKLQATLTHWVTWARAQAALAVADTLPSARNVFPSTVETTEATLFAAKTVEPPIAGPALRLSSSFSQGVSEEEEARDNTALIFDLNAPFGEEAIDQDEARDNTALIFDLDSAFEKGTADQEETHNDTVQTLDTLIPASTSRDFRILPSTETTESDAYAPHSIAEPLSRLEILPSPVKEERLQYQSPQHDEDDLFALAEEVTPVSEKVPNIPSPFAASSVRSD